MRLSEIAFSDAYLGEHASWLETNDAPGPQQLPVAVTADATKLREQCLWEAKQTNLSEFAISYDSVRYRVSRMHTVTDEIFVVRKFPAAVPDFSTLGLVPWANLLMGKLTGMIIIAGAYGSGKTTTASSLLVGRLQAHGGVGVTIEDPPEMPLEGIHGKGVCYQTATRIGEFGIACRAAARWAPSMIFLGEIRDDEAASEALKAGLNGRVIIATLHADDISSAIERLHALTSRNAGSQAAASMLSNGLAAVLHQSLTKSPSGKLVMQSSLLFLRDEDMNGARHIIRGCSWQQLDSEINRQANKMLIAQRRSTVQSPNREIAA